MRLQPNVITREFKVPETVTFQSMRPGKHSGVKTVTVNLSHWIHPPGRDAKDHLGCGTWSG